MNDHNSIDESPSRSYLPDRADMEQQRLHCNANRRRSEIRAALDRQQFRDNLWTALIALCMVGAAAYVAWLISKGYYL